MAAVLAGGQGAVLSHRSAADAWGLRPSSRARHEITTPTNSARRVGSVDVHRTRALPEGDVTRVRRIPVTTLARTYVDCASVLSASVLARCIHEGEVLRILDVAAIARQLDASNGKRGVGVLRRLIAEHHPQPVNRGLEELFLRLCRRGGLPPARLNEHVSVGDRLAEVDALWRRERVVVEVDDVTTHRTARAFQRDRERDAALIAEGYVVLRFTWKRMTSDPDGVIRDLRRTLTLRDGSTYRRPESFGRSTVP